MGSSFQPWFNLSNAGEVPSPALLVYPDRVTQNLQQMIATAGGVGRLRPHMKTHKMPEMIRLQLGLGITKFKCATIAEAEMTAACGAAEVLVAYQPVGPNAIRLLHLIRQYPKTSFAALADDEQAIRHLANVFSTSDAQLSLFLDLDCGQHRCGIEPGVRAQELYQLIHTLPGLCSGGLHAYDGHIHESDLDTRTILCETAFNPILAFRDQLIAARLAVPRFVVGGTPTFPIHARRDGVECSPGTCVFWDAGYSSKLSDLNFMVAALMFTRVISKPGGNRLCLDLGHKALAAEMPHPRAIFPELPDAKAVAHSEEHLVIETARAAKFEVGDCFYAIPWHICPTVALHSEAVVVRNGRAEARWKISARERRLTV